MPGASSLLPVVVAKMEDVNGVTATSGRGGKGRLFSSGSALGVRGGRSRAVPAQLPSS